MLALPLHPRLAGMVLRSGRVNRKDALDLAAMLSERDFLAKAESADLEDRVHCLHRFRHQGRDAVLALGGNPGVCRQVDRVSRQLTARLKNIGAEADQERVLSLGGLLALAYPDRIAARRSRIGHSYKLVSGRGGRLPDHDSLAAAEWLVVASQDVGRRDGRIFLAAAIEFSEVQRLFQQDMVSCDEVWWDGSARMVVSRCCIRFGELLVTEKKLADPDPAAIQKALIQGIRESGLASLAWSAAAEKLRARICCLREWQPEAGWPDFSGQALHDELELWLAPYLFGLSTLKSCCTLNLERILRDRLDFSQQQRLNRDAPTHIQVPSGSRIPLRYQPGRPPVLAVRLQEMFGLAETPAVCQDKVQVLLHLLSPAGRPVQVTRDLRGFWDTGYFAVRRELKGRYPRHHWPEDPWKAVATPRVKRRKNKKTGG
jgi:ATP-dependent helicase HrpB